MNLYSNGKLLLTGEYVVLDGAKSLAIPTKFGQNLKIQKIKNPNLIWKSYTNKGTCWFEACFSLAEIRLISTSFNSKKEKNDEFIAETLEKILKQAQKQNSNFLNSKQGYLVETNLTFPKNWGLGSSSTLINNIASWANIDAYKLLWNTFNGSGYDIACAQNNTAIFYELKNKKPHIKKTNFKPYFSDNLFFIYLNKKQNSREGVIKYKNNSINNKLEQIKEISFLSEAFLQANTIKDFNKIIIEHEKIISLILKQSTVKETFFNDYFGQIKSLGAWGGDFILASGNEKTPHYFKNKGFKTILTYKEMVL